MKYFLGIFLLFVGGPALAQAASELNYVEVHQGGKQPELFGFAFYKICEIKQYMIPLAYIFISIAFVIHVFKGIFGKFDWKALLLILIAAGSIAMIDYIVAFAAGDAAFYCPTTLPSP